MLVYWFQLNIMSHKKPIPNNCYFCKMNKWTKLSIEYANQRSYLDDLFQVYPTIPNGIRNVDKKIWQKIEKSFNEQNNKELIKNLLLLEKFPVKDSYVSFLRMDNDSIDRNPQTINRLAGNIYQIGLSKLYEKCTEPKETNTQMGGKFSDWLNKGVLGVKPIELSKFIDSKDNAILKGGGKLLTKFAKENFGYTKNKGLDFVGRFNGKYVIAETKFISAVGGNQGTAFTDVITTITNEINNAIAIGIIDGCPSLNSVDRFS